MAAIQERTRGERMPAKHPGGLQNLQEHRGLYVLTQRLFQLQFLRPFDVVADIGGVDAWARDLQLVEGLDCLEFDDARSGQPGERDVLGQLSMRPGRRPERRGCTMSVEIDREIEIREAAEDLACEDFAFSRILEKRAPQQQRQRDRNQLRHCRS
jgi:hypothetical protein